VAATPRSTVEKDFFQGKRCAICGEDALVVNHLESLPDYISCFSCEAAFVVEHEGERVLYGKIPDSYPSTQQFALKQWAWLEAIENRARMERPEEEIAPPESPAVETTEVLETGLQDVDVDLGEKLGVEPPEVVETPPPPSEEVPIETPGIPLEVEEEPDESISPAESVEADIPVWLRTPAPPSSVPLEPGEPAPPMRDQEDPPGVPIEPVSAVEVEQEVDTQSLMQELEREGVPASAVEDIEDDADPAQEAPPFVEDEPYIEELAQTEELNALEDLPAELESEPEPASDPEPTHEQISEIPPIQTDTSEGEAKEIPSEAKEGDIHEPAPGTRARVILRSVQANFPENTCVHCMRTPARKRMVVISGEGTTPETQVRHTLQICNSCHRRAQTKSDDEKNARLMGVLTATLISLAFIVLALALGWVTFQQSVLVDAMLLGILAVVGYTVPAWLLLTRASRFPPPPDAKYVRSTLLTQVAEGGVETVYDWRNEKYAKRFVEANYQNVSGDLLIIEDITATETEKEPELDGSASQPE
jgi:hypothetical protein